MSLYQVEASRSPAPATGPAGRTYRPDIDGLRCIAITAVVFYHAGLWPLTSGYVGVDIFFVISGFLIGGILHREVRDGSFRYAAFYARRAKRILPPLIAMTLLVCLAAWFLMSARELRTTGLSSATALVGISNLYFWWSINYFQPAAHLNPFLMTWSLGVEEQFYVFFPVILIALEKLRPAWRMRLLGLIVLVSFVLCYVITSRYPAMAFYLLPMRAWEMGAGAMLAIAGRQHRLLQSRAAHEGLGWAGLAAVVAACLIFDDDTPFPGIAALLPVAGAIALILSERSWVNRHLLSSRIMVGIGLISYSWYLWHAPLMALVRLTTFESPSVAMLCAVGVVSMGFAYLSWRFVEQPFRHVKAPDPVILRRYGLALAACALVPVAFVVSGGFPQRLSPVAREVETVLTGSRGNPCLVFYGAVSPRMSPTCQPAAPATTRRIALLGDSHASALAPGLLRLAEERGMALYQFEKSSCAPLLGATRTMLRYPRHGSECAAYNQRVFDIVSRDTTIDTVVLAGYWSAGTGKQEADSRLVRTDGTAATDDVALLGTALADTARRYHAAGKKVVIVADVPLFAFDPGKEAVSEALPVRRELRRWLGVPADVDHGHAAWRWLRPATPADRAVKAAARSIPGVTFIDPATRLCDATGCAYGDRLPYYIDFQHLSAPGASLIFKDVAL